jgi:hypothetical protein
MCSLLLQISTDVWHLVPSALGITSANCYRNDWFAIADVIRQERMTLGLSYQASEGRRQMTKKSEEQEEDNDIGRYLSYLIIDDKGKNCFINGESRWTIPLPNYIDEKSLENLVYKYCHEFDIDYVSSHNVSNLVNETMRKLNTVGSITKMKNKDHNKKQRRNQKKNKDEKTIAMVVIEEGEKRKRTLVLTTDKFYLNEEFKRPYKENNSKVTGEFIGTSIRETGKTTIITMRPPILSKVLKLGGSSKEKELLVVQYGSDEILGDVKDICECIAKIGGVASQQFKVYVSAILEAQRDKAPKEITYPAVGVFENPENNKLLIAMPQSNNVYTIGQAKENGEVNERICEVANRTLPSIQEEIKAALIGYIRLPSYFKYATDTIPVLGYAVASVFAYELKGIEKSDFFCQFLQYGPKGTGKSTILNIGTDDLYGIAPRGIDALDSSHRLLQMLNATTMPQHIAEIETFDFNEFASTIKNGTDIRKVGSRYNADQTRNDFEGKSTLFYSANSYKASKDSVLARVIIAQVQTTKEYIEPTAHLFSSLVRSRTRQYPIGYAILQHVIEEYPNLKSVSSAINAIRSELAYRCATPDINVKFTDQRRTLTYALILFGIRQWASFIHLLYPKLKDRQNVGRIELWFNKYSNLDLFIEDVVRPLETTTIEVLQQQNVAAAFVAWLESFVSNQGEKEEGHTWMRAKDGRDLIYVASGVLQKYKEFCRRSGGTPYESLKQLGAELTAHTGESCKPFAYDIGRDEERDSNDRIIKTAVPYKKRSVVGVPLSIQGKIPAPIATTTASNY